MKATATLSLDTRQRLAVVACFATMFMVGVTISLLGPSLPGLAEQTGIALPRAGIFFTLFASGALLATLVVAWLMDRPVRHALLVGAALLMGGAQWLVAGSQTLAQASIAIALTGLAMSTTGTAPNAIIADLYRERTGQALNALHLCAGLGSFIGPLLIGGALHLGSNYTLVFRLAGLVMLLVGVLWAVSLPPRPRQNAGGHAIPLARNILVPMVLLLFFAMLYTGTEQAFGG